jgi:hypothetical protein
MANPPGMKTFHLEVNEVDKIHVYWNSDEISLQLRRNVPTVENLEIPSFKAALKISPGNAHRLGLQLLNISQSFYDARKAKAKATKEAKLPKKNP